MCYLLRKLQRRIKQRSLVVLSISFQKLKIGPSRTIIAGPACFSRLKITSITSYYFIGMLFEKLSFVELLNCTDKLKALNVTGSWCIYVDKRQAVGVFMLTRDRQLVYLC